MKIIECVQGDSVWHSHRKPPMRNASDTPSVMGNGYESRSDFMRRWVTGIEREHDEVTQDRFAEGHRFEKLALPLMEEIVGESLYPVVGVNGKYSASFDGLTAADDIAAEHKSLNDEIRACQCAADLAPKYKIQMEVQLFVSGASKCLFMATNWDANDNLLEEKHFWYEPDLKLRASIDSSWDQFEEDARDYKPPEVIPAAVAAPTMQLPALSIQVTGSITLHDNLKLFGAKLEEFIAGLDKSPENDQAFADSESAIKTLKDAEEALEAAKANGLAQVASVEEMTRTVALYAGQARACRLMLTQLVKDRKQSIRVEIVQAGKEAFTAHVAMLNKRIGQPFMFDAVKMPDFSGAIKGKKTVSSLRDAVDTLLASAKIDANSVADKAQINLKSLDTLAKDHVFLFRDIGALLHMDSEAFDAIVINRVRAHQDAEKERLEAEREKIRAEEAAKLQREQAEKGRAEAARVAKEALQAEFAAQRAAQEQRTQPPVAPHLSSPGPERDSSNHAPESGVSLGQRDSGDKAAPVAAPSRESIVHLVACQFGVTDEIAYAWIVEAFVGERKAA